MALWWPSAVCCTGCGDTTGDSGLRRTRRPSRLHSGGYRARLALRTRRRRRPRLLFVLFAASGVVVGPDSAGSLPPSAWMTGLVVSDSAAAACGGCTAAAAAETLGDVGCTICCSCRAATSTMGLRYAEPGVETSPDGERAGVVGEARRRCAGGVAVCASVSGSAGTCSGDVCLKPASMPSYRSRNGGSEADLLSACSEAAAAGCPSLPCSAALTSRRCCRRAARSTTMASRAE